VIHVGDCLDILPTLPAESVQCVVTSPPYYALRDYGVAGQIGLERAPDCLGWATLKPCGVCFVCTLVRVFREVRRVLRDDGTLWLNLGDSYAGDRGAAWGPSASSLEARAMTKSRRRDDAPIPRSDLRVPGLKPKDLMGMPWRIALALQADGWWLRQDIVWAKPNPMPESTRDRCTKAHEYLFLLAKSGRYYFNQEAILEPSSPNTHPRLAQNVAAQAGSTRVPGKTNGTKKAVARGNGVGWGYADGEEAKPRTRKASSYRPAGWAESDAGEKRGRYTPKNNPSFEAAMAEVRAERNKRSVWTVTTQPFKEAHFATFPEALIEPCILAGSRDGDLVLDPFMGAGTTAVVCERLARRWVGCELNPEYAAIARRRLAGVTAGLPLGASA
jgi:DNA modification methylase